MKYLPLFLLLLIFNGCSSGAFEFKNISEFSVNDTALHDMEKVRILHASGGPDNNSDVSYYYHLLVCSEKGDTVNLLTPLVALPNQIYFKSRTSDVFRIVLNGHSADAIQKVVSNPQRRDIEYNHYPTAIGVLVDVKF